MKLYIDRDGDREYLVTDDGEAVYVDDLREDGRDTELLEQAISVAKRGRRKATPEDVVASQGGPESETD